MKRSIYRFTNFLIFLPLILATCTPVDKTNNTEDEAIDSSYTKIVKFNDRLFSLPSPFQTSILIKNTGVDYNKELLNPTNYAPNYTTEFKQALNLGVYGASLGYLNIYEQLPDAALYFAVVKILARELGVTSAIDQTTLQRFEKNKGNKDSLIYVFSEIYRKSDSYLINNERTDIAVLVLAGGWVESMYLLTHIADLANKDLVNRIGEQKYPLENLIAIMRPFYGQEGVQYDKLLNSLIDLATVFDGVVIEYVYEDPEVFPEKQLSVIKSQTKTIISDYQYHTIKEKVSAIRKTITE